MNGKDGVETVLQDGSHVLLAMPHPSGRRFVVAGYGSREAARSAASRVLRATGTLGEAMVALGAPLETLSATPLPALPGGTSLSGPYGPYPRVVAYAPRQDPGIPGALELVRAVLGSDEGARPPIPRPSVAPAAAPTDVDPLVNMLLREESEDRILGLRPVTRHPALLMERRVAGEAGFETVRVRAVDAETRWRGGPRADTFIHLGAGDPGALFDRERLPWPGVLATAGAARALGLPPERSPSGVDGLVRVEGGVPPGTPWDSEPVAEPWPGKFPDQFLDHLGLSATTERLLWDGGVRTVSVLSSTRCGVLRSMGLGERELARLRKSVLRARRYYALAEERAAVVVEPFANDERMLVEEEYPDWFLDTPLDGLDLTPAVAVAVSAARTVGEARSIRLSEFLGRKGLGKVRAMAFRAAVSAAYAASPGPARGDAEVLGEPIAESLGRTLPGLNDRDRVILSERFCAKGRDSTLEELAVRLGVTAERIRQIEVRSIRRVAALGGWGMPLRRRLGRLSEEPPTSMVALRSEAWAVGLPPRVVDRIVGMFSPIPLHVAAVPESERHGEIVAPLPPAMLDAVREATRSAARAAQPGEPYDDVMDGVLADLPGPEAAYLRELLRPADEEGWQSRLSVRTDGLKETLLSLVHGSPVPVTVAEVVDLAVRLGGETVEPHRVRAMLADGHLILPDGLVGGRGLLPSRNRRRAIVAAAIAAMGSGGTHRRWTTQGINRAIVDSGQGDLVVDLHQGVVEMLLREAPRVREHGRGQWSLASARGNSTVDMSFAQVVERVLEREGVPMRPSAIVAAVTALRGPSRSAQVKEGGRVVRLSEGLWGLVGRDLPISPAQEERLLAEASGLLAQGPCDAATLRERLLEAGALPDALDVIALASFLFLRGVAKADRHGVMRGRGEPFPPGEGTVAAEVLAILGGAAAPLTAAQVENAVASSRGRVSPASVRQALAVHARREGRGWVARVGRAAGR